MEFGATNTRGFTVVVFAKIRTEVLGLLVYCWMKHWYNSIVYVSEKRNKHVLITSMMFDETLISVVLIVFVKIQTIMACQYYA